MFVSAIMTPAPLTVTAQTSLDEVLEVMDRYNVRHLPVVEGEDLTGIVSDRDVLDATGWLPSRMHECRGAKASEEVPRKVSEIMHTPVAVVGPESEITAAGYRMLEMGIESLPVVRGSHLVGIVTANDLLDIVASDGTANASGKPLCDDTVRALMTQPVRTIGRTETLGTALDVCREFQVRHLPVMDGEYLVGIVTDRDMRRALGVGRPLTKPIGDVMTTDPVTIDPEWTLAQAARVMVEKKLTGLPVVDSSGLTGILSSQDLLKNWLQV